jgi:type I restriction enzyme, S subunit
MNQKNHSSDNIPPLRFPEFAGEWEKKKLGEVAEIKTGAKDTQHRIENGSYPFFVRSNTVERINSYSFDGEAILTSGDGVGVGKNFHYINGKFDFHQRVYSIRNFKEGISGKYIYNIFSEKFYDRVIRLSAKNSVDSVRMDMIAEMELSFPTLPEQTKIASFLTAVDEKIQALKKKHRLLAQYKKGVMQKIFSQELRFKDENGEEFAEWEVKKLGEVFSFKVTNSFSRNNLNYEKGEVRNIHYGDIHTKFKTLFDIQKETVPFINQEIAVQKISEDNYCKKGDMIFADASEDLNDVGKSIEIVTVNDNKVLAGLHTILARPHENLFSTGFAGYLFKSNSLRTQIQKEAQGSKVLSISASRLSNILIPIPCPPEQTLIANFLSSLDEKINHTTTQIEKMEVWKKGLLQKMFV